jgi:hypothetical protein
MSVATLGAVLERTTPTGEPNDTIKLIGVLGPTTFAAETVGEFGPSFEVEFADLVDAYGVTGLDVGRSEAEIVAEQTAENHRRAIEAYFGRPVEDAHA